MNHTTNSRQSIPYAEIVEMVLRPDLFLLVSKKGELVFVFRSMLQDENEFVRFLCSQKTKSMAHTETEIKSADKTVIEKITLVI